MAWPVPSKYKITTPFAKPGKMWKTGRHEGVDFAAPVGTPVFAAGDGKVTGTGVWGSAYGSKSVVIKHGKLFVMYAHMSKLEVKKGQSVKAGQKIGEVGREGNVTGPHLHLEAQAKPTWTRGGGINPAELLASGGGSVPTSAPAAPVAPKKPKASVAPAVSNPKAYPGKPVKPGDKGPHILELKKALGFIDDTYDPKVVEAVKKIQRANKALGTPDGIMGPKSWKAIVK
jgi:murein DD-endopeptidase MepM/ murein hydrolase activator NlpD